MIFYLFQVLLLFSFNDYNKTVNTCNLNDTSSTSIDDIDSLRSDLLQILRSAPDTAEIAFAVIREGQPTFVGYQKQGDSIIEVNNRNSIFEIGSISKVFTSTLLAKFVVDGTIDLDESINSYLPFELHNNTQITFLNLSNHTSGLPRMPDNFLLAAMQSPTNPFKAYSDSMLYDYLQNTLTLEFESGTDNQYSNLGTGLLGFVLANISGHSFAKLLDDIIFSPFNMRYSTVGPDFNKGHLVHGYDANGRRADHWEFGQLAGAGGIYASISDLAIFASHQINASNDYLLLTHQPTYTLDNGMKIGLGWHIVDLDIVKNVLWHNGGTTGFTSSFALDKEHQNGVILLSNISAYHPASREIDPFVFKTIEHLSTYGQLD